MAAVAELAQHLLMTEVLEICESVHKQMEDKQITVYQKGDVQIVEVAQNLLEQNETLENLTDRSEQPLPTEDAVATVNGACSSTEMEDATTLEAAMETAPEHLVDNSPKTLVHSDDVETVENEMKAQEMECTANQTILEAQAEPPAAEQVVITTPSENDIDQNVNSEADVITETNSENTAEDSQEGLKRKRGRPCKTQSISLSQSETSVSSQDDAYKSKLRQRSVTEGGYIRLHKGTEKKLQNRKPTSKSAIQQVCWVIPHKQNIIVFGTT